MTEVEVRKIPPGVRALSKAQEKKIRRNSAQALVARQMRAEGIEPDFDSNRGQGGRFVRPNTSTWRR